MPTLRAVCVGYLTVERNPIKQYFTRRAIIIGGPALADDATDEEVVALLEAVKTKTRHLQSLNSDLHETTHQSASQKHAALTKKRYTLKKICGRSELRFRSPISRWLGRRLRIRGTKGKIS